MVVDHQYKYPIIDEYFVQNSFVLLDELNLDDRFEHDNVETFFLFSGSDFILFFFDSDFDRYFWKKKNINFTNKTEIINQNCFLCLVKQQQQQRNNQFVITYDDDNVCL